MRSPSDITHTETVRRYNVPGACKVRVTDWPYECKAKDLNPEHVVYTCETHRVWWHEPDHQPPDLDVCDALRDGEPVASTIPAWTQPMNPELDIHESGQTRLAVPGEQTSLLPLPDELIPTLRDTEPLDNPEPTPVPLGHDHVSQDQTLPL